MLSQTSPSRRKTGKSRGLFSLFARAPALEETHRIYAVAADITVDETAAPTDYRHRFHTTPGTARLLFLDPVK